MFAQFIIVVQSILLITTLNQCNCISREFFVQTLSIQNHSDIVYYTDTMPESLPRFLRRYQFSHINQQKMNSMNSSMSSKSKNQNVKFVISFPTINETLEAVATMKSSLKVDSFPMHPWTLLLWPESAKNEIESTKIIEDNFMKLAENISIQQEFYVAFLENSTIGTDDLWLLFNLKYTFYEIYTQNKQLVVRKVQDLGTTIVQCMTCPSLPQRRFNLQGVQLLWEGVQDPEFNDDTLFGENEDGDLVLENSLAKSLTDILQTALNFTVKLVKGTELGRQLPDGNWVGAVKDIVERKADVCVTTASMLPKRAGMVSFLPSIDEHRFAAFFMPPSLNAIRDIFMQPFQPNLWAAVIATWSAKNISKIRLSLASAMVVFTIIRKKIGANDYKSANYVEDEPDFTQDSLIWALATICQQGWDEHPYANSLRAIFISASFTGVIAYAGYSAAIVSTLSLRIDPIQSPEALIKSNLRLGLRAGFLNDVLLAKEDNDTSNDDIITRIKSSLSKRPNEGEVNITTGVSLLQKEEYAFIGTREAFYDILKTMQPIKGDVDSNICGIKELRILKQGYKNGMFTRKGFPYKEFFKLVLLMIRERGILWRVRDKFTYTRRCLESSDNAGRALGGNDVFTAFMILLAGKVVSATILAIEKMVNFNKPIYIK